MHTVVEFIHGLVVDPDLASRTDSELLKRFLANRDENAFEALVRRHGPMVLGLCRRILRDPQEAEDAFQAAFLIFVRRAASIVKPELLGNWLYGVASRTAHAARAATAKRRVKEANAVPREQPAEESAWTELQPFLDHELSRLPAKYRIPVILCHLEEKSRQEAAQALGVPEGTLSSRLARARAILAQRLTRHCPAVMGGALLAGLGTQALAAALPTSLIQITVKAGISVLAGRTLTASGVSAQVASLTDGVLRTMFLSKLKIGAVLLCVGSLLAIGMGTVASHGLGSDEKPSAATPTSKNDSRPLLNEALETAKAITNSEAKLRVLLRIASVQYKTGDKVGSRKTRHAALELAKSFADGRPRADALLSVAWAQIEVKDRESIAETLRQTEQAVPAVEDANEKATALLRLVMAQATAGDYEGGLRTVRNGADVQPTLLSFFASNLKIEDKAAARKTLTQALAFVKFDEKRAIGERIGALSAVAGALVRAGDLEHALKVVAELGKEQDQGLEAIAAAQAGEGNTAGALRTSKSIQQVATKADALEAVARAQANAGDLAAARTTLDEVRELADKLEQAEVGRPRRRFPIPNSQVSRLRARIALTQLLLGDRRGALMTVAAIPTDLEKADALLDLGINQMTAGKRNEAREILLAASLAAQKVVPSSGRGRWPPQTAKAATLRLIAREQAKAGDIKEAVKTANCIPTDQEMDIALAGIAAAQAEAGDRNGAMQTTAEIRDGEWKAAALEGVTRGLVRSGNEKEALALAAQQTIPVLKVHVLLGVVLGKTKPKAPEE
jgi:RNA polymerase sigma factor (sigma-70 family)